MSEPTDCGDNAASAGSLGAGKIYSLTVTGYEVATVCK